MTYRSRILTAAAVTAAAATVVPFLPAAVAARPAMLGIQDDRLAHTTQDPAPRMAMIKGLKAKVVRVDLRWDLVATSRPTSPRSPNDPAYDWSHYDKVVAAARARKVNVMFTIWGTPAWAADPRIPATGGLPESGRAPKSAADAGNFAAAAAARYSRRGVHMWEAWNEPNIPLFLQPQAVRKGGKWVTTSPRRYSAILKAMYKGIKSVDRRATVAGAVTAPAGDKVCTHAMCRVPPRDFLRALNGRGLRPPMDAVAHHPYPLRKPSNKNFAGASYIDLYNLPVLTRTVDSTYLRGKPIWLTEFGVATKRVKEYRFIAPNYRVQAAWLKDAVQRVNRTPRVKVFIWYLLQDHPNWTSGLFDENGKRKPSANTFRSLVR